MASASAPEGPRALYPGAGAAEADRRQRSARPALRRFEKSPSIVDGRRAAEGEIGELLGVSVDLGGIPLLFEVPDGFLKVSAALRQIQNTGDAGDQIHIPTVDGIVVKPLGCVGHLVAVRPTTGDTAEDGVIGELVVVGAAKNE